ncbi:putative transmembrane protein, RDD family domain [Serinibacter arcticus]|uniref:Putative transmembrane protein, RDD family domain n=1 Tax=Serinibacter arcticus TaxID=1655435 RepID=A0A4Z1E345_9MICO|nr:putative transmembrane protein, RDD family domain [Serinibacter arcticus]
MGQRLAAYAVDLALVGAVLAVGVLLGSWILGVVLALEVVVISVVVESRYGLTLGKLVTRTRTTTAGGDLAPGLRRGATRAALFGAAHLAAGLGQIALLAASGRATAWHDRVAGTDVVTLRSPTARRVPAASLAAAVPAVPTAPAGVPAGVWPGAGPAGSRQPGAAGAPASWRPPELLDVPVSSDSISMREFRALRDAAAGRPPAAPRPAVAVPPRPGPAGHVPPSAPRTAAQDFRPPAAPAASSAVAAPVTPAARIGAPAVPAPPVTGAARVTRVVLSPGDGATHTITGSAVVGRRPRAESEDVQVVEIADVARSLSRTHVRIRVTGGVAWVEDAGSANGTRLRAPDGTLTPLGAGVPVRLVSGAVLELGQVSLGVTLG